MRRPGDEFVVGEAGMKGVTGAQRTLRASRMRAKMDAAFAAGEMDLLARLDGSRSVLEAELTALEQANSARKACIALDRMLGKVNP